METTLEAKQQYIAREILEKGFNGEDFISFLKTKKPDGGNLETWTADELTQTVGEYQKLARTETLSNDLQVSQTFRGTTMMTTSFGDIEPEVHCIQADKTDLSDTKEMTISLSYPEKKKDSNASMGKKFTVSFLIEAKPYNYKTRRNAEDFVWLRNIMRTFFPGLFIPPISKKPMEESTKDDKIEKRMKNYERFLNSIAKDDLLRSSKLFFDFLTTAKESEYKLKMKAYEKITPPKNLSELQSRSGTIQLQPELMESNEVWTKTTDNIQANLGLLKKLNVSFKSLLTEMRQVSTRFTELSTIYSDMSALANSYRGKTEDDCLVKNYDGMKNLMLDLSYFYKKQAMIFDLDLKQHVKFVTKEYSSFKELRDNFNNSKTNYNKGKDKLMKKKEDLFNKKELKKWELKAEDTQIDSTNKELCFEKMLPVETEELFEAKRFCCYLGCSFDVEFDRIGKQIEAQNIAMIDHVFEKNKQIVKELGASWNITGGTTTTITTVTTTVA